MSGWPPYPEEITEPMIAVAFSKLTRREREVLVWIVRSKRDGEIARILGNSTRTVTTHVCNLLGKLNVELRIAAAMEVVRSVICRRPSGMDAGICPCCGGPRRKQPSATSATRSRRKTSQRRRH